MATPVDGAANERLGPFFAGPFEVQRASVSLPLSGWSCDRLLAVAGTSRLPPALAGPPAYIS